MEKVNDNLVVNCIDRAESLFLKNVHSKVAIRKIYRNINLNDLCFYRIKSITFEKDAPRKEALENVFSTMRLPYVNVLYLIIGQKHKVSFYYGLSRDLVQRCSLANSVDIHQVGASVLKKGLESNYRGSVVDSVDKQETQKIVNFLNGLDKVGILEGVAGSNGDGTEDFQRADRLIDVMLGDEFALLVTSIFLPLKIISELENNIFQFYDRLYPLSKFNRQNSTSKGTSNSSATTGGTTTTTSTNKGKSNTKTVGKNEGGSSIGKSLTKTDSSSVQTSDGSSEGA